MKYSWYFTGIQIISEEPEKDSYIPISLASGTDQLKYDTKGEAWSSLIGFVIPMLKSSWKKLEPGEVVFKYLFPAKEGENGVLHFYYSAPLSDFAEAVKTVRKKGELESFIFCCEEYTLDFGIIEFPDKEDSV